MPDPNEFVYIKHPKVNAVGGPVTRQAFEEVHKAKGWTLAKADDVPDDAEPIPVAPSAVNTNPKGS